MGRGLVGRNKQANLLFLADLAVPNNVCEF
jgi:hypothetical protein